MIRLFTECAILMAITAVATYLTVLYYPNAPSLYTVIEPPAEDEVTLQMIEEKWNGKVQWIDARTEEKYIKEHIPGAILINEFGFDQQVFVIIDKLQDMEVPLVIYCEAKRCEASRKVADKLGNVFPPLKENIWVLQGGWPEWKKANP